MTYASFPPFRHGDFLIQVFPQHRQCFDEHPCLSICPSPSYALGAILSRSVTVPESVSFVSILSRCRALVRVFACVCVPVLICPLVFPWHPALFCAQACLGDQMAPVGLNNLYFFLHVRDSQHGAQSKALWSGILGFKLGSAAYWVCGLKQITQPL